MLRIAIISDTHGLLRPEAEAFLRGADHIVHGGDITTADLLDQIKALAPVTAVRGNNDNGAWADRLPVVARIELGGVAICVIHDLKQLDRDRDAAGARVIVSGHSHKPSIDERGGVLFINPGSAGPRRFRLPIAAAELTIDRGAVAARIATLVVDR